MPTARHGPSARAMAQGRGQDIEAAPHDARHAMCYRLAHSVEHRKLSY